METTDLNAYSTDELGFRYVPDFGPPCGFLRRLQSEIRAGTYFHSVQVQRDLGGKDMDAALQFQNDLSLALVEALQDRFGDNSLVSCFKVLNPQEVPRTLMGMRDWGCAELEQLCSFYGENKNLETGQVVPAIVSSAGIKGEYRAYKIQCMSEWRGYEFHRVAEMLSYSPSFSSLEGPEDASDLLVEALILWKSTSEYRFLYSNPNKHLSVSQASLVVAAVSDERSEPGRPEPHESDNQEGNDDIF
ncbi:hypothetical protein R1sor_015528 [Riccia sorocarpa]|uniref:Uncharacterized protein n=1 Tax=Riccia sorocarpa TaxID=122646 RepID=A0ABD3HFH1_9MARC